MWITLALLVTLPLLVVSSPLRRRKDERADVDELQIHVLPSGVPKEKQWEEANEDVLPNHLEGVRMQRDGEFNKV